MNLVVRITPAQWLVEIRPGTPSELRGGGVPARVSALLVVSEDFAFDLADLREGVVVATARGSEPPWLRRIGDLQVIGVPFELDEGGEYGPVILNAMPRGGIARTAIGYDFYVPEIGRPLLDCAGEQCADSVVGELASLVGLDAQSDWTGRWGASADAVVSVEALLFGFNYLGAANPQPQYSPNGDPFWEVTGVEDAAPLSDTTFEVLSRKIEADSRDRLLWAGVAFGLAGGLVASALVAIGQGVWEWSQRQAAPESRGPEAMRKNDSGRGLFVLACLALGLMALLGLSQRLTRGKMRCAQSRWTS